MASPVGHGLMGVALYALLQVTWSLPTVWVLALSTGMGLLIYLCAAYLSRSPELRLLVASVADPGTMDRLRSEH